jgi:hypothetical protein
MTSYTIKKGDIATAPDVVNIILSYKEWPYYFELLKPDFLHPKTRLIAKVDCTIHIDIKIK